LYCTYIYTVFTALPKVYCSLFYENKARTAIDKVIQYKVLCFASENT